MLHDASAALCTQNTLIHRMVIIAFDIADTSIFDMHINPTAAGAHITGRLFYLV